MDNEGYRETAILIILVFCSLGVLLLLYAALGPSISFLLLAIMIVLSAVTYQAISSVERESRRQSIILHQEALAEAERQAAIATESERQREIAEAAAAEKKRTEDYTRDTLAGFTKYLSPCLIIDSNIWMNEEYNSFFFMLSLVCHKNQYRMSLYGPQFDEISNIKRATQFGDERNKRARLAMSRIEEFQKHNMLRIEPVTVDAQKRAYADPLLVKLITNQARKGIKCTFVSDDKELRIRVRQHLVDYASTNWEIVEVAKILPRCNQFHEAWKSGSLKNVID